MKRLLYFLALLFLVSCQNSDPTPRQSEWKSWMQQNGKVKVLTTIAMIGDLVEQVGGEHVDVIVLVKGDLDPHTYQLVKGDDEKLQVADLIFYNGLGLEHGPSLKKQLQESEKAVPVGDRIATRWPELILHYNGQIDPHIWMDISLWSRTIPFIVEALSQMDPEHAEVYAANGKVLEEQMANAHQNVLEILQSIPSEKRFLVTSHDAFNYFAKTYLADQNETDWQKRFQAPEGLAPESQLSSTDIQFIIDHMSRYGIEVLFPESNVSLASLEKILQSGRDKGLNLKLATTPLYGDAMGQPGSSGDTYIKMIEHNAKTIASYLLE